MVYTETSQSLIPSRRYYIYIYIHSRLQELSVGPTLVRENGSSESSGKFSVLAMARSSKIVGPKGEGGRSFAQAYLHIYIIDMQCLNNLATSKGS